MNTIILSTSGIFFGIALALLFLAGDDLRSGKSDAAYRKLFFIVVTIFVAFSLMVFEIVTSHDHAKQPAPKTPRIKIPGELKKGTGHAIGDTLEKFSNSN